VCVPGLSLACLHQVIACALYMRNLMQNFSYIASKLRWEIEVTEGHKRIISSLTQCQSMFVSDGSRSKFFDPGQVGSIFCGSGWVGLGQPFMVWVWIWKISPKNVKFFNFFPFVAKKLFGLVRKAPGLNAGRPLFLWGSKVNSGWVRLGQVRAHL